MEFDKSKGLKGSKYLVSSILNTDIPDF